jgi:hypothetical protein
MSVGRPSDYTPETANAIIEWIAEGKPLREFCRQDDAPAWRTVYHWLEAQPEFQARFTRARDVGADAIAEEALKIADTPVEGVRRETGGKDGDKEVYEDMLGHRKLQVETRLKLLAKWHPKKYGDKIDHSLTGKDGGPIVISNTDAEL